jgi:hypothetical protein
MKFFEWLHGVFFSSVPLVTQQTRLREWVRGMRLEVAKELSTRKELDG